MSETPLNYPYVLTQPFLVMSKINIECIGVVLNQSATFRISYLEQTGGNLNQIEAVMSPEEYSMWSNDDSYVVEWAKKQINHLYKEYTKYYFFGGSFCILNIYVDYLKEAKVFVGLFDETEKYVSHQSLLMSKEDYDIWTQSNTYLVAWVYNQIGKVPL